MPIDLGLPSTEYEKLYKIMQFELPFDSGNMRYNAAEWDVMPNKLSYYINVYEADYTEDVFDYYILKKGINFMYNATVSMYNYLDNFYNGNDPQLFVDYEVAKRSIDFFEPNTIAREETNVLHGSGFYASESVKSRILGGL
jgi:hypothetical protein